MFQYQQKAAGDNEKATCWKKKKEINTLCRIHSSQLLFQPSRAEPSRAETEVAPDMLQRHLHRKRPEINVLPQNAQSLITYQKTVSLRKVKPRRSFISQMETAAASEAAASCQEDPLKWTASLSGSVLFRAEMTHSGASSMTKCFSRNKKGKKKKHPKTRH